MRDVTLGDRQAIQLYVYRRLLDASFRDRLVAVAPEGNRPIVIALPEDAMRDVLSEVAAIGGAGNVVAPVLNGLIAFRLERCEGETADEIDDDTIDARCTVGVFLERLRFDGGRAVYAFAQNQVGHAEVVAVAG